MTVTSACRRFALLGLAVSVLLPLVGCAQLPEERREVSAAQLQPPVFYDEFVDDPVLNRVRGDVDRSWANFPAPPTDAEEDEQEAAVMTAAMSLKLQAVYQNVQQSCKGLPNCEIPVLIRTRKLRGSEERVCFAVLPFLRYAVLPGQKEPQTLIFYLARWNVGQKTPVRLLSAAQYSFNRDKTAPLVGKKSGVYIHELHIDPASQSSVRKDLGKNYFARDPGRSGPLRSVWSVGNINTWSLAAPDIGAVRGGVMAIPLRTLVPSGVVSWPFRSGWCHGHSARA